MHSIQEHAMNVEQIIKAAEGQLKPPDPMGPPPIENIGGCEWSMGRVGELEAEMAENEKIAQAAHRRVDEWLKQANEGVTKERNGFVARIFQFMEVHKNELLKGGQRKSRTFPYGSLGWRKHGGRLKVLDAKALADWAQSQPVEQGLYRIKVEPEVRAIQTLAKTQGLVPPGTEWEEERDEPFVDAVQQPTTLTRGMP